MSHCIAQLSVFNRIKFVESTHKYFIDGEEANSPSVTNVIKRFKSTFDVDAAASRIAKRTGESTQAIKESWEINNKLSTSLGSILHKYIENSYHNKKIPIESNLISPILGNNEKLIVLETLPKLINQFKEFNKNYKHLHSVKNELVIGDIDDTQICGMVDLLAYNSKEDYYEIIDFKTNKKISNQNTYKKFLKSPFNTIPDTELGHYTVQLNIYKYIITKYTNINVKNLKIVWFNSLNENYVVFDLEDIQGSIKQMFELFSQKNKT
jgi:hypothetical protein